MRYTKIPETTFEKLQLNAGILLTEFDTENGSFEDTAIIGATTGGISFSAVPTYSDYGEDIDNCPKNTKELKKIEDWTIGMSGSFITADANSVKRQLGAADVDGEKITPRTDLLDEDFDDLWWVGDYSDENSEESGGFVAIHMMNTLSTGGFSLQTGDKTKGSFAFDFTAHYSITEQDVVPFEVFVKAGA